MKACLLSALCLLGAWAALAEGVTVKDGDLSFPLDAVKQLKDLQEFLDPRLGSRRKLAKPGTPLLCSHSLFPEPLRPLCKKPNAQEILQRLETIANDPNTCEICAYAACTGC